MAELAKKRNLVLAGHGAAGKTTLAEALLFKAKATSRWGKVDDGTSHLDYEDDERERKSSVYAGIGSLQHKGVEITVIDTPGYPDFIGEVYSCMPVAEIVGITISASGGIGVNTRKCWELASDLKKPKAIFVTHIDTEHASFQGILGRIREVFGDRCIPANVPIGEGPSLTGVASVLDPASAPAAVKNSIGAFHQALVEDAVEADDALMEKYLESGSISRDDATVAFRKAIAAGTLTPIYFVGLTKDKGYEEILDAIADHFPSPADVGVPRKAKKSDAPFELRPDGPFAAQVFRLHSAVVGKQAFLRVWSGSAKSGGSLFNVRVGKPQKIGDFLRVIGRDGRPVPEVSAGDIVMLAKVDDMTFGDTLTPGEKIEIESTVYPRPMVAYAIRPKTRNDETKLGESLAKLGDEDPTFIAKFDPDTKELVARGLSELHLQLRLRTLKERYKVEVETTTPRIPYRETITVEADAHHRHKKQTGGAGQFGEVYIKITPLERGAGFEFVDDVVGGVIPNSLIPAVEKGIREKMVDGVIAGYPVVDFRVSLYDGKHHPVDSKEIAFKTAGREAFKKAVKSAKPRLLEPIVDLTVAVPSRYMGDVTGDLNGRRGRVIGMDTQGDVQMIKAQIPLAEVQNYSASLRSMTGGEGSYTIEFSHYDIVPDHVAQGIISQYEEKEEE
jgi:elongation factor G